MKEVSVAELSSIVDDPKPGTGNTSRAPLSFVLPFHSVGGWEDLFIKSHKQQSSQVSWS